MIKVLIVDDHPVVRTGAVTSLSAESDFEVIGEAASAPETLELVLKNQPDVILMDIRLKGNANGVALAKQIRVNHPSIKILVFTNYSNEPYIRAMMEIGVEGYILKDTPARDVIDSLRMVMDGKTVFSAPVTQKVVQGYLGVSSRTGTAPVERVTERETEVLQLLADGVSNTEIAERLHVSVATVQFHLTNIYSKLGVRNRAEAVIQAAREGMVVIDE